MTLTSPPAVLQQSSHSAQLFREWVGALVRPGGGLVDLGGLAVTQNGSPNMSVNVGAGRIFVPSTYTATVNPGNGAYYPGGPYFAENDAAVNLAISASNPTNPRIDTVIVQVQDAAYFGSTNSAQLAVLTGTPTSGATLGNLNGAASVPASSMVLVYVLVPANATSIVTANISANQAPLACTAGDDTSWAALTLGTNVSAVGGAYAPSARLIGDRVWLRGAVTASASDGGTVATIPAGLRPASTVPLSHITGPASLTQISTAGVISNSVLGTFSTQGLDGINFSIS